jgi:galacturan 1,4-alpha-galacturonidase
MRLPNSATVAKGIKLHNLAVEAVSNNVSVYARNTDFFDSVNVDSLDVKNIWVNIGDGMVIISSSDTRLHAKS